MTGTAVASFRVSGIQFQVWVRSINHRFLEIQTRCPRVLEVAAFEQELEERVRQRFFRGRLEVEIAASDPGGLRRLRFNRELARDYLRVCQEFTEAGQPGASKKSAKAGGRAQRPTLRLSRSELFELLRLPGVVELDQALPANFDRKQFFRRFEQVITGLHRSRLREGRSIAGILRTYLRSIETSNRQIRQRHGVYKKEKLASIQRDLNLSGTGRVPEGAPGQADPLKYAVDWLDRGDISEELERVDLHVGAVRALIAGNAADAGKQIDFYSQELLREVNTIAAKSRDIEIRHLVVAMKTQIENIKEQIRNVC